MTISINIDHLSDDELYRIYTGLKVKFDQLEKDRILNWDMWDRQVKILLTYRISALLMKSDIVLIKDLIACRRSNLLKINGIGPRSLEKIERLLGTYGLELAGE